MTERESAHPLSELCDITLPSPVEIKEKVEQAEKSDTQSAESSPEKSPSSFKRAVQQVSIILFIL